MCVSLMVSAVLCYKCFYLIITFIIVVFTQIMITNCFFIVISKISFIAGSETTRRESPRVTFDSLDNPSVFKEFPTKPFYYVGFSYHDLVVTVYFLVKW